MIKTLCVATLLAFSVSTMALAADDAPKKAPTAKQLAQRQRMKDCNAEAKAKALKGPDRKGFMKTCLRGGKVTATVGADKDDEAADSDDDAAQTALAAKTKDCKRQVKAQGLKGDDRKAFMKTCLDK